MPIAHANPNTDVVNTHSYSSGQRDTTPHLLPTILTRYLSCSCACEGANEVIRADVLTHALLLSGPQKSQPPASFTRFSHPHALILFVRTKNDALCRNMEEMGARPVSPSRLRAPMTSVMTMIILRARPLGGCSARKAESVVRGSSFCDGAAYFASSHHDGDAP
mmetsp:Transcript_18409/g.51127  ORF Transcript_18409/g.51127 Transcript_18409/m.51127 type:complete len:164 (-) Transcript_18409:473-964(-)